MRRRIVQDKKGSLTSNQSGIINQGNQSANQSQDKMER